MLVKLGSNSGQTIATQRLSAVVRKRTFGGRGQFVRYVPIGDIPMRVVFSWFERFIDDPSRFDTVGKILILGPTSPS
jgi:hypothetical protein